MGDSESCDPQEAEHVCQSLYEGHQQTADTLTYGLHSSDAVPVHQAVQDVSAALDVKMGKVAQPLRVAVVGRAASPGIDVTLQLVGKDACLRRIDMALEFIRQRAAN